MVSFCRCCFRAHEKHLICGGSVTEQCADGRAETVQVPNFSAGKQVCSSTAQIPRYFMRCASVFNLYVHRGGAGDKTHSRCIHFQIPQLPSAWPLAHQRSNACKLFGRNEREAKAQYRRDALFLVVCVCVDRAYQEQKR